MIYCPEKYKRIITDVNSEFEKIQGEMEPKQAKLTLAKFLRHNIGFTTRLLTGIELAPYQIINLKGMLNGNFTLCVWGRGAGKTFCAAIYCILQSIFEPGTKILVAGPTFRTARFIFNHIEQISERKDAFMLMQALGVDKAKRNDEFSWKFNGGSIRAIPLNGEKIRGFRANILVIDEFLLMDEELVERVLMPYLSVPQDVEKRIKIRAKEDQLIKHGLLKEEERIQFKDNSKLIALSSASYTCEYLYRKYEEYIKKIYDPSGDPQGSRYFVSQMAWDSIPEYMMDKGVIAASQNNEAHTATFKREYGAQFIDGSESYFSMKKMIECTIPDGEDPTLLLKERTEEEYILAIDPNFSNSPTADNFAMCLGQLDKQKDDNVTVVHSYAKAGKDLKDHIKYLYYILTNFNVVMIVIDYAGYQFIEAANESELFRKAKIELKIFDFESDKDGADYEEQLKIARRGYNKTIQKIVFSQYFTTDFIRKANEWLQGCIDYKKIWFGGAIKPSPSAFLRASEVAPDLDLVGEESIVDFIDTQEILLKQTKYECASIEVKTTAKGVQSFDLPMTMKNNDSADRPRRDSYTALMLMVWAVKCLNEIKKIPPENDSGFCPMLI
jgi:hypothetical protein